ncbi:thioredoxin family protein [Flavobacterium aquicola]|uniref:Protein disulfide-isomerase n=1 Tax=Flavobacterium aquicola TaxID=1682742 RepID=A0A3E0ED76_9FLAO|nr:thioredoxin family protein [Flavobacterium aquicola]REG96228.1 protein disulfide-isomerase [Flavobacterium aquicola]
MKKIILVAFFFIGISVSQAQDSGNSANQLKWYTDVKEAIKVSDKEKKPLMLFFTGSDWCGWCIRLQKEVLTTPEFSKWANESVILVELDFPRRTAQPENIKVQNNELQQVFGIQGFPTIYFANAKVKDGKTNFEGLGSTGYVAGGPAAWIATAETFVKKPVVLGPEPKKSKSKTKKA